MIMKILLVAVLSVLSLYAKEFYVIEGDLIYSLNQNKKTYCKKFPLETIRKVIRQHKCVDNSTFIKRYTKGVLKFRCNTKQPLYVIGTQDKKGCKDMADFLAKKLNPYKYKKAKEKSKAKELISNSKESVAKRAKIKKIPVSVCSKLDVTDKVKSLCRSLSWGGFVDQIRQLVCVGYSESVCFKKEDKKSAAKFFKQFPAVLKLALNKVANYEDTYHAQKLIEEFDKYIEDYGLEKLSGENRVKFFSTPMNILYNPDVFKSLGSYPVYQHRTSDDAQKRCEEVGAKLPSVDFIKKELKAQKNLKIKKGVHAIIVAKEGNALRVVSPLGVVKDSWGDLLCIRDKNKKDYNFEILNKVTFAQSQDFCKRKGEGLLSKKEAKRAIYDLVEKVYLRKIRLKLRKGIATFDIPYANSARDYGYITYKYFKGDKPESKKIKVFPINQGSKNNPTLSLESTYLVGGKQKIKVYRVLEDLGLEHYPPEYRRYLTVSDKRVDRRGSKREYFFVFGVCKKGGVLIKNQK